MAPTATRSDSMSAPLSPKFDQSLHRSRTFQSTLFSDDAAAAPLSPTKAAKRVIVPPTADTAAFSPPRPAKKQLESVDSSMPSIMKPPNQESTSSKASNKYITRYLHAAGSYRPPTGYITDGEAPASPRSAKKMVSPRNDTTMRFYFGTEEPPSPVRKARVPPGGHSSVSFLWIIDTYCKQRHAILIMMTYWRCSGSGSQSLLAILLQCIVAADEVIDFRNVSLRLYCFLSFDMIARHGSLHYHM